MQGVQPLLEDLLLLVVVYVMCPGAMLLSLPPQQLP
jgi:hypothetical protein